MKWVKKQGLDPNKAGGKGVADAHTRKVNGNVQGQFSSSQNPNRNLKSHGSPKKEKNGVSKKSIHGSPERESRVVSRSPRKPKSPKKVKQSLAGKEDKKSLDVRNALAWLKDENTKGLADAKYFKKIDKMLPKRVRKDNKGPIPAFLNRRGQGGAPGPATHTLRAHLNKARVETMRPTGGIRQLRT